MAKLFFFAGALLMTLASFAEYRDGDFLAGMVMSMTAVVAWVLVCVPDDDDMGNP